MRPLPLVLITLGIAAWITGQVWIVYHRSSFDFEAFYLGSGVVLIIQLLLAVAHRPYKSVDKDEGHVVVIVPVYNEHAHSLRSCLEALLKQTRLPDEIHVVDDGSNENYTKVRTWFKRTAKMSGVGVVWIRQKNQGKRAAHVTALANIETEENTIIVTVDSDSAVDYKAIEEGLKPFKDAAVESVAGLVLARNVNTNLLSRITDMLFVGMQQLIDRSAMSELNSVLVNSGALAFYRMSAVSDALNNGYANETFMGRKVGFSDDSFLTLFALLRGKTVQQPTAIVFVDMPITFSHHYRQQMRWMRGSFIRSLWRLRYLPVMSWALLRQLVGFLMLFVNTTILIELLFVLPLTHHRAPPLTLLLIPLGLGFVQSARYFTVERSDVTISGEIVQFLLAPLASLYSIVVMRGFRFYGMLTCLKTGWNTRQEVEIHPEHHS